MSVTNISGVVWYAGEEGGGGAGPGKVRSVGIFKLTSKKNSGGGPSNPPPPDPPLV